MDSNFSTELRQLVAKSRYIAIELGYDYISTLHFYIADCESGQPSSLIHFGFEHEKDFINFKSTYIQSEVNYLDNLEEGLPLTIEAEKAVRMAENERTNFNQAETLPCHLFLATLKNKESLLYQCFSHNVDIVESLMKYYNNLCEFEKNKIIENQKSNDEIESKENFLTKIFKKFR